MEQENFFNFIHNAEQLSYKTMSLFFKNFDKQLNISQVVVLAQLKSNGEMQPSTLAKKLGFTYGALTAMVNKLEHLGYVERKPQVSDRRTVSIGITEEGAKLLQDAETLGNEVRNKVYSVLQPEEIEQMVHIQRTLLKHVDTLNNI